MYYIYCYTNIYNQKKYIGQTNNINRRMSEHRYEATHSDRIQYNTPFHKALRNYGEDAFQFDILEILDTQDQSLIDEREKYWIKEKNSYKLKHGYNLTYGGQGLKSTNFYSKSPEIISALKQDLQNSSLTYEELSKKYNISPGTIVDINKGRSYFEKTENYPIRKRFCSEDQKQLIAKLLTTTTLTRQQIADEVGVSLSTVKRIKSGQIKVPGYDIYPLQKPVSTIKG